ncbi:MAG: hypothetical protein QMD04_08700 [Anaerolineales bacterium]|nr:hypothetical protein [Anaerolineales bacterium]
MRLSEQELKTMRKAQEELMTETVYIQAVVAVSDGAAGSSESLQTIATTKGRIGTLGRDPREREIAGRMGSVHIYVVSLPADTMLSDKNQLQINGRQFVIGGVIRASSTTALRAVVAEVL